MSKHFIIVAGNPVDGHLSHHPRSGRYKYYGPYDRGVSNGPPEEAEALDLQDDWWVVDLTSPPEPMSSNLGRTINRLLSEVRRACSSTFSTKKKVI